MIMKINGILISDVCTAYVRDFQGTYNIFVNHIMSYIFTQFSMCSWVKVWDNFQFRKIVDSLFKLLALWHRLCIRLGKRLLQLRFGTTLLTSLSFSYLAPVVAGDLRLSGSTSFVWITHVRVDHRGIRDLRSTSTFLSRESGSTEVFEVARTAGNGN